MKGCVKTWFLFCHLWGSLWKSGQELHCIILALPGVPHWSFLSFGKGHSQPETNLEKRQGLGYHFNTLVLTLDRQLWPWMALLWQSLKFQFLACQCLTTPYTTVAGLGRQIKVTWFEKNLKKTRIKCPFVFQLSFSVLQNEPNSTQIHPVIRILWGRRQNDWIAPCI